jgi:hypothetical protein
MSTLTSNYQTLTSVSGTGTVPWTNPEYAQARDTDAACSVLLEGDQSSDILRATGRVLTIPSVCTVNSRTVTLRIWADKAGAQIILLQGLIGGVLVGENYAPVGVAITGTAEAPQELTVTIEAGTPGETNAANSGAVLQVQALIDAAVPVEVFCELLGEETVDYTEPTADPEEPTTMAYATATELATWTGETAPADAVAQLERASRLLDSYTLGRIDTTDTDHQTAARDACCAQVAYWIANPGIDDEGGVKSRQVGKTRIERFAPQPDLAPDARRILFSAGLLYQGVMSG